MLTGLFGRLHFTTGLSKEHSSYPCDREKGKDAWSSSLLYTFYISGKVVLILVVALMFWIMRTKISSWTRSEIEPEELMNLGDWLCSFCKGWSGNSELGPISLIIKFICHLIEIGVLTYVSWLMIKFFPQRILSAWTFFFSSILVLHLVAFV